MEASTAILKFSWINLNFFHKF